MHAVFLHHFRLFFPYLLLSNISLCLPSIPVEFCAAIMPRISDRQKQLRDVMHTLQLAIANESSSDDSMTSPKSQQHVMDDHDSDSSTESHEQDTPGLQKDVTISDMGELYFLMYNSRYLLPRTVTAKSIEFANQFFHNLPEKLFRQMTKMNKATFFHLCSLIQGDPIFHNDSFCPQSLVSIQLAVCLDRLGHHGNGACLNHMIPTWGVSTGSLVNFSKRCFHAIQNALQGIVMWLHKLNVKSSPRHLP